MTGRRLHTTSGQKFGRLLALERDVAKGKSVKWRCLCECGNTVSVAQDALHSGKTKSCSCLRDQKSAWRTLSHGMKGTRVYKTWAGMKQRATNPNNPDWRYYGGRGIKLCERWHTFANFFEDMGVPPEHDLIIDRINPDGDYEPGNCRWATRKEQRANQR